MPFAERVDTNFKAWLGQQINAARQFTPEQLKWLKMIRDHIAGNHSIESQDFEYSPFIQNGGLGGFYDMFGDQYAEILKALNSHLVA